MAKSLKLNTGANMPIIGYGTWQIIFNVRKRVRAALDSGYRLIDTAKVYGNEPGVGAAVKTSGIKRSEIFVTTKLWNRDQGFVSATKAFDNSLKRLGLQYIDLYLIHWPSHDATTRKQSWLALEEIYKSGVARAIGVSNYTVAHLEEIAGFGTIVPAVNQIEFHPYIYETHLPILEYCREKAIVVEAYSPLAHGRYSKDSLISEIAKSKNATNAQIMLAWAMVHNTVPLPKTTDAGRMVENLAAVNIKLSSQDVEKVNNLSRGERVVKWH